MTIDGLIKGLGTVGACNDAAAYFPDIDAGVSIKIYSLLSSTLVEIHVITLVLECISAFSSVNLFMDSQALLDMCLLFESRMYLDFCDRCWIEKKHVYKIIKSKNLLVCWNKIKGHSGIMGNEHADFLANTVTDFDLILPINMSCHFLSVEDRPVSRNAYYFVRHLFDAVNFVGWNSKCVFGAVNDILHNSFNMNRTFHV
ncbi:hypothetical protein G9A89_008893 [Geosiphon pyriformis]|nr:hypothetical protein G9A89_008893 [Geosiphon pyriformis]